MVEVDGYIDGSRSDDCDEPKLEAQVESGSEESYSTEIGPDALLMLDSVPIKFEVK